MEEEFEFGPGKFFEKRLEREGAEVSEGNKVHKCLSIKGGYREVRVWADKAISPQKARREQQTQERERKMFNSTYELNL